MPALNANQVSSNMPIIGVFGGTFNPIHAGHLALAHSVLHLLQCAQIRFIPAALPPHKRVPQVSAQHRAAMVQLAIAHQPAFVLDTCELARTGPSYSIETLRQLKGQFKGSALCLIIGQDSYQQLCSWHAWELLTDVAHLLVVHRAGLPNSFTPHPSHLAHVVPIEAAATRFATQANGLISFIATAPPDISSTHLRALLRDQAGSASPSLLPEAVRQYILAQHLYLPDSAT